MIGEDEGVWTPLKIEAGTVGEGGEITILYLEGVIDTVSSMKLKSVMDSFIDKGNIKLVVDMSRVEYVSSSGWGVFSSRIKEIRERGGDIKIFGMDQEVDAVFHKLGFDAIMRSFSVLMEAIEDFKRPVPAVDTGAVGEVSPPAEKDMEESIPVISSPGLSVKFERRNVNGNFAVVVDADGTIDSSTSYAFEEYLVTALEKEPKLLVIDLSDIVYMSSSGWGVIVKSMQDLERLHRRMVVAGMNSVIFKIFRDLGFEPLIPHYRSVESALEKFAEEQEGISETDISVIDEEVIHETEKVGTDEIPRIERAASPMEEQEEPAEVVELDEPEVKTIDLDKRRDLRVDKDKRVKRMGWKEYGRKLMERNLRKDDEKEDK